ncbi:hypothetical protein SAMN04490220_6932 [Rhodococcus jostii]|uniref:Uncharacterized protein n=1 Tax=Rhodococcus jostii TaxID=132919 RepID=A0A1H5GTI9_RHOJO|nr:hypothetical protein SAMN04490220_6932 [Rhodococcus jostii]
MIPDASIVQATSGVLAPHVRNLRNVNPADTRCPAGRVTDSALDAKVNAIDRWSATRRPPAASSCRCSRANVVIDAISANTASTSHRHRGCSNAPDARAMYGLSTRTSTISAATAAIANAVLGTDHPRLTSATVIARGSGS